MVLRCHYFLILLLIAVILTFVRSYEPGDIEMVECCYPLYTQGKGAKYYRKYVDHYEYYVDYKHMRLVYFEPNKQLIYYEMDKHVMYHFDDGGCFISPVDLDPLCESAKAEFVARIQVKAFNGTGWQPVNKWRFHGTDNTLLGDHVERAHFTQDKIITDGGECYKATRFSEFDNGETITNKLFNEVRNTILDPKIFDLDISGCVYPDDKR